MRRPCYGGGEDAFEHTSDLVSMVEMMRIRASSS